MSIQPGLHSALAAPPGIQIEQLVLASGITLSLRSAGPLDGAVVVLLHGFPQGAFVWDGVLLHLASLGYRAVAPNLRGFERSSAPPEVSAYRAKHLVADIVGLMEQLSPGKAVHALVAHDWGGAAAWNLANQHPQRIERLCIVNSPHPGPFLRALQHDQAQQAASAYMNFLTEPGAAHALRANGFALMWQFLNGMHPGSSTNTLPDWVTPELKAQHEAVWAMGLQGGCNYYAASPLRPATQADAAAQAIELPASMLHIGVPTHVLWGMQDTALLPCLLDGLDVHVPELKVTQVPDASHWVIHEQPKRVQEWLSQSLQ